MKSLNDKFEIISNDLIEKIDSIIDNHNNDGTKLLGILLDIQDIVERHYIPEEVAYYLSEKLNIKITQIYDVISFFSSLSSTPRAKYPIQVCNSIVCKINDNDTLFHDLKSILGIDLNQVTYDGKFTLEEVPCFGACDVAPAVRVNGKVYGHLTTKSKIEAMLNSLI